MKVNKQNWKIALRKIAILLLWTTMLSFVVIVLAFSNKQADEMKCKKVFVSIYPIDLHFYNRQRVLEIIRKALPKEQKLLGLEMGEINVGKLEHALQQQQLIELADIYSEMDGTLNIRIEQRRPILRVMRYDGTQYYLDQYGVKIPLSEHFTSRVPFANGNVFERYEKGDSVYSFVGNQLYTIASYVDKHPFYKALIEQIFVRADNELILVPKMGSRYIIFGDANEADKKFKKLLVFYQEGLNRIGWSKYKSIDVRFEGQVICKK